MKNEEPAEAAWQRYPLFRFFASVKLAMLLLAVLILAIIAGTLWESSFDARVARAYIYDALWFYLWLLILAANLICSALSRMPWKRHHTGFLLTHLGIILVLAGALIGHFWGVEGSMTLFKGDPPNNLLTVDQHVLQVIDGDNGSQTVPLEMINRHPSPASPWPLTTTPSGWAVAAINYSPALDVNMVPRAVSEGGNPALHFTIKTARMGQSLQAWLLADDAEHGTFDMGLAGVEFKRGTATPVAAPSTAAADLEETIFAFGNSAAGQVSKVIRGGSTGVKVQPVDTAKGESPKVLVTVGSAEQSIEIAPNLSKSVAIAGTPFTARVEEYWPDFRIRDGKPENASQDPNNPCVLVTITGRAVPVPDATNPADASAGSDGASALTAAGAAEAGVKNHLTLYVAGDGGLSYELSSRKMGLSSGKLEMNKLLPTGWADWTLVADQYLPAAEERFDAHPAAPASRGMHAEGILVRATRAGTNVEQWVPLGWQISVPTEPRPLLIGYGNKQIPLPIGLSLRDFQVDWNEGTDTPAGFKSTLDVVDRETGDTTTGQCWMNHPMSVPDSWWNTLTGLTFKLSQASWNPQNLSQSSIQILRDPGWSLKWMGSLVIVMGIFSLFYLRPYPMEGEKKLTRRKKTRTMKAVRPTVIEPKALPVK
jgi:hypothetical protein